ncbi:MAG: zinc-binding dehydrogenase [Planctomycetota bacterium]|jgi:threonine dehydrogenase-like Zn-dependent dehydrogenase|nr:zinc-binding dehydrogenase [Planctomycetota bacterium]
MKTAKLLGNGQVGIVETERPTSDDETVLIQVKATGLCGSELHGVKGPPVEREGFYNGGHEVAGIIQEAPSHSEYEPGMRVGARVVQGCGNCDFCDQGYETACRSLTLYGQNGHAEYFRLGIRGIQPLPDDVDWPAGVLLSGDGLGVPVRAALRLGDTAGKKVVVLGLGPVGLSSVVVQVSRGAEVMGIDLIDFRTRFAEELGAARGVNSENEDAKEAVLEWTAGQGADIVILAVGNSAAYMQAIDLVRQQGTLYQVGELSKLTFNPSETFLRKEITIKGSWYYTSEDWKEMLALHERGVPYDRLITHVFPFGKVQEAFAVFISGESGKVILTYD